MIRPVLALLVLSAACDHGRLMIDQGLLATEPRSLDFTGSGELSLVLRNTGQGKLEITEVRIEGDDLGELTRPAGALGQLAKGEERSVTVVFQQKADGQRAARLVFVTDSPQTPEVVVPVTLRAAQDDAGVDGGAADAGPADAGPPDAGTLDAGPTDAGSIDGGSTDAGSMDAGPPDAGAPDAGNVAVPDAGGAVTRVLVGEDHACALLASGEVKCWGGNNWFQSGGSDGGDFPSATTVPLPEPAVSIGGGTTASCAIGRSGALWCWGTYIPLPPGGALASPTPLQIALPAPALEVAASNFVGCAIIDRSGGELWCWGYNTPTNGGYVGFGTTQGFVAPAQITAIPAPLHVVAGSHAQHVLTRDGGVYSWGHGAHGELGDGRSMSSAVPLRTALDAGAIDLFAGTFGACGLTAAHAAYCWGDNGLHRFDPSNATTVPLPIAIGGGDGVQQLGVSIFAVLMAKTDGGVACRGGNNTYSCATQTPVAPAYVADLRDAGLAGATGFFTRYGLACAQLGDGGLLCWGENDHGGTGDGTRSPRQVPIRPLGL